MKHIGIIAVSSEGALLFYRSLCELSWKRLGKYVQPEIMMHSFPLKKYMDYIEKEDWEKVGDMMHMSVLHLKKSGADFAVCPDNTVHMGFDILQKKSSLPLLSIIETVIQECLSRRYKKVGLLGTKYTMEGPLYKKPLEERDIKTIIPSQADEVNEIILNELGPGQINDNTYKLLTPYLMELKAKGCEAVILGCTELPIILSEDNSPIPVLDTTRLFAQKTLEYAIC